MSPTLSPSLSRAATRRAPNDEGASRMTAGASSARFSSSVIEITPRERRDFRRARETLPQLVGQLGLRAQVAIGTGDPQTEPEGFRRGLHGTRKQVVVKGGPVDLRRREIRARQQVLGQGTGCIELERTTQIA